MVLAKLEALVPPRMMAMPVRVVLPVFDRVTLPADEVTPTVLLRLRAVPESVAPGCSGVVGVVLELPPQPMMPNESKRTTTANLLWSIRNPIDQNL